MKILFLILSLFITLSTLASNYVLRRDTFSNPDKVVLVANIPANQVSPGDQLILSAFAFGGSGVFEYQFLADGVEFQTWSPLSTALHTLPTNEDIQIYTYTVNIREQGDGTSGVVSSLMVFPHTDIRLGQATAVKGDTLTIFHHSLKVINGSANVIFSDGSGFTQTIPVTISVNGKLEVTVPDYTGANVNRSVAVSVEGIRARVRQSLIILDDTPPVANFSMSLEQGEGPLTIVFIDQSTISSGAISSWKWIFGDGQTSVEQNPVHTFVYPGNYNVILQVTANNGQTSSFQKTVIVNAGETNQRPIANIQTNVTSGQSPLTVTFDASGSSDPDGSIAYYLWAFRDGTTASGVNPTHTFTQDGYYNVELRVIDSLGKSNFSEVAIVVGDPLEIDPIEFSNASIEIIGANTNSFNPINSTITFRISGATINAGPEDVTILHNSTSIPSEQISVNGNDITVTGLLAEGLNEISINMSDTEDLVIDERFSIWAGSHSLTLNVVDSQGNPIDGLLIKAILDKDQNIFSQQTTNNGNITFTNLPLEKLLLVSEGENLFDTLIIDPIDFEENTRFISSWRIPPPIPVSAIDNNDFSLGTDGWHISDPETVEIVPHEGTFKSRSTSNELITRLLRAGREYDLVSLNLRPYQIENQSFSKKSNEAFSKVLDNDLKVSTKARNEVRIGRSFPVNAGKGVVTVRYRFVTKEVPAGFFGFDKFDDTFKITLKNLGIGGASKIEYNSVKTFGASGFFQSFAADGTLIGWSTYWRELTFNYDVSQNTVVQLTAAIKNIGDEKNDSWIIFDKIEVGDFSIKEMKFLNDVETITSPISLGCGSKTKNLQYISADTHSYYGGNTRLFGKIVITGKPDDILEKVSLQYMKDGGVAKEWNLASRAGIDLSQPFGADKEIVLDGVRTSWDNPGAKYLFDIPSIDMEEPWEKSSADGTVSLQLRVETESGLVKTKLLDPLMVLKQYKKNNRYGSGRDPKVGGDDWGLPSIVRAAAFLQGSFDYGNGGTINGQTIFTVGDFSKMNGGCFKEPVKESPTSNNYVSDGHGSHRYGLDVDFKVSNQPKKKTIQNPSGKCKDGINNNAITRVNAYELIAFVNTLNANSVKIEKIYVEKEDLDSGFRTVVQESILKDVIGYELGHCDHFHLRIKN